MTVYQASTLDLLASELDRHRRYKADTAATVTRWRQEVPSMGLSIAAMTERCDELGAVIADLESLMAIVRGANATEAELAGAKGGC